MRLIDADALKDAIRTDIMGGLNYERFIDDAPTIDAVPVVRCKDCFHSRPDGYELECTMHYRPTEVEDFCSYGEMR